MNIQTFYFNPYRECTYVLSDLSLNNAPDGKKPCLIIDAGMYSDSEQRRFQDYLSENNLTPVALLITHSHPDHICGAEWLQATYGLQPATSHPLCETIHTPGHHPDCVCYYFQKEKTLFSGDTLFCESIGRTDLPGGDSRLLAQSLQRLSTLPDDTTVYPGHGVPTTMAHEKQYNPYM